MPTPTSSPAPAECFRSAASFSPGFRSPICPGTNAVPLWSSRATTIVGPTSWWRSSPPYRAPDRIWRRSTLILAPGSRFRPSCGSTSSPPSIGRLSPASSGPRPPAGSWRSARCSSTCSVSDSPERLGARQDQRNLYWPATVGSLAPTAPACSRQVDRRIVRRIVGLFPSTAPTRLKAPQCLRQGLPSAMGDGEAGACFRATAASRAPDSRSRARPRRRRISWCPLDTTIGTARFQLLPPKPCRRISRVPCLPRTRLSPACCRRTRPTMNKRPLLITPRLKCHHRRGWATGRRGHIRSLSATPRAAGGR